MAFDPELAKRLVKYADVREHRSENSDSYIYANATLNSYLSAHAAFLLACVEECEGRRKLKESIATHDTSTVVDAMRNLKKLEAATDAARSKS